MLIFRISNLMQPSLTWMEQWIFTPTENQTLSEMQEGQYSDSWTYKTMSYTLMPGQIMEG